MFCLMQSVFVVFRVNSYHIEQVAVQTNRLCSVSSSVSVATGRYLIAVVIFFYVKICYSRKCGCLPHVTLRKNSGCGGTTKEPGCDSRQEPTILLTHQTS